MALVVDKLPHLLSTIGVPPSPSRPRFSRKHRIVVVLSENGCRCAKYYCSGQVRGALTFVPSALVMRDLGFCEFASSQAVLSGLRMLSDVPRIGIFCTFGRKKRQHAAVGSRGRRIRNMSQVKSGRHVTRNAQRIATRRKQARRVGCFEPSSTHNVDKRWGNLSTSWGLISLLVSSIVSPFVLRGGFLPEGRPQLASSRYN